MKIIQKLKKILRTGLHFVLNLSLFAGIMVFQKPDTLQFIKDNVIIDTWILTQDTTVTQNGLVVHSKKVKVAENSNYFIVYDEYRNSSIDSLATVLSLYTPRQKKLWEKKYTNDRRIDFDRTKIFDKDVAIVTTDNSYGQPILEFIHDDHTETIIEKGQWQRIVDFSFAPGMRYLVLHVRNPHSRKMWDFIHFIDRQTNDTWTYLFPICVSCKRNKIKVQIDDEGTTEVIYKDQHRVFNKTGSLVDFFFSF